MAFLKLKIIVLLFNLSKEMKKLVLFAAVAFAASMVSCGSSDKAAEAADSAAVVEEAVEV